MTTQAVLFDFDGTLAPNLDLPDMRRQVIELTHSYQVPEIIWRDQYIVEIIDTAAQHLSKRSEKVAEEYHQQANRLITEIELAAAARTDPFPGVRRLLRNLQQADIKLGVVTRNCRAAVLATFPDLLDYVDHVSARGDCDFLKPDPRHARHTLDQLGAAPNSATMIGDGHLDMQLGRSLHMHCIGVLSGSNDRQTLLAHGAHRVIDRLDEATQIELLLAI